jgi:hypothetical protein
MPKHSKVSKFLKLTKAIEDVLNDASIDEEETKMKYPNPQMYVSLKKIKKLKREFRLVKDQLLE